MKRLSHFLAALGAAFCALTAQAQNLLQNASFETAGSVATGWTAFGNVFREPVGASSGTHSIKLFGNFAPDVNMSGIFQDRPASPGQEWSVSVTGRNLATDALQGGNRALLLLEFRDATDGVLATSEAEVLTALSPVNVPTLGSAGSIAPAGTVKARLLLLFVQQGDLAGGAAFFDDVSATVVGQGSVAIENPSFETGDGPISRWTHFNNAFRTSNGPRTGAFNLTLATGGVAGAYQDFPAFAGQQWRGSIWAMRSSTSDPLQLPDYSVVNIEWRNATGGLISFETVLAVDGFSPLDTYIQSQVSGTAPAGTATARFVVLYFASGGSGTAQFDDAEFVLEFSPPPPPPPTNLLNNPGFEDALGFDFSNTTNWNGFFGGPAGTFLQAFNNTGATPRSGNNALVTTIRGTETTLGHNAFTGHVQIATGLIPGRTYNYSVWARGNPTLNNGAEFRIEWQNASGGEVGRFNMPIEGMLTGEYQQFTITDTAPAGAVRAAVVMAVQSFLNSGTTADTSVAWDDASLSLVDDACPLDFNDDGIIEPGDIDDFITAFFSDVPSERARCDFNNDGLVEPGDLDEFITLYFEGC